MEKATKEAGEKGRKVEARVSETLRERVQKANEGLLGKERSEEYARRITE
jgi:hypothetical protein